MQFSAPSRITAVLGPTNTGKTHLAIERMLGHASGMIGFPLRLLARENYDRIVRLRGPAAVALITGEERIIPQRPQWFVCTVEAMPLNRVVDFLAIDEIQLAADPDRGHVFTHRLLHARGRCETMFLGADTIRPLIRQLIPDIEVISRPRLSKLTYSGPRKLTRLPRRSAVVAFSAQDVYSIAELIRRTRGGAAVVLGALSPRTRNAQVALFQSGEVEHLVATDAIGMGLNMQIDHVAFAATRKFDGHAPRDLTSAEVAQIGGRAGRHLNDGTFGTTGDVSGIDPDIIEQVENHEFPPLRGLFWRSAELKFTSIDGLLASLAQPSRISGLMRTRPADDQRVLETLARDPDIAHAARGLGQVRLLWEVSQIPDFRKLRPENHARLVGQIFNHLTHGTHRLPTDWVAGHLAALDRADGDMHTLMDRIASIRIWTYVSHRANWLDDAEHWRDRARAIEDMLSDALHDRLTQRFVDVRTSVLAKRLRDGDALMAAVSDSDAVSVEGHHLGHLEGLTFIADQAEGRSASRAVQNAAEKALRSEINRRVDRLCIDDDEAFVAADDGDLMWRGAYVARLLPGTSPLRPQVEIPQEGLLTGDQRERVRDRLDLWFTTMTVKTLSPLLDPVPESLGGPARGILFQLSEALGTIPTAQARTQIEALDDTDRRALARLGLRLGRMAIYVPRLFKPPAQRLRAILWSLYRRAPAPAELPDGRMSLLAPEDLSADLAYVLGYRLLRDADNGNRLVRVDGWEQASAGLRTLHREQQKAEKQDPPLLGVSAAALGEVLSPLGVPGTVKDLLCTALGWRLEAMPEGDGGLPYRLSPLQAQRRPGSGRRGPSGRASADFTLRAMGEQDSAAMPFAALRDHVLAQQATAPPAVAPSGKRSRRRKGGAEKASHAVNEGANDAPTSVKAARRRRKKASQS